ncbi:MAG: hypothetical protein F4X02_07140 [Chloroflexi bacterium]|nr:hypothetical protein [Chloroflexota bacterium]
MIDVAAHYHNVYYSLLAKVETAEELVDFAEGYLPYRGRNWASTRRCAEDIELAWQSQREISLRAAYKAVDYGLQAKIDPDPAVVAQLNPVRGVLEDPFHPDGFGQHMNQIQSLIDSGERDYKLSPDEGAVSACTNTELYSLRSILPDYRQTVQTASAVASITDLLHAAELQRSWNANWTPRNVERYDDGRISRTPRNGLLLLLGCREAGELLWHMHLIVNDSVSSAALALAGVHVNQNPFIEPLRKNRAKVRKLIDRIENAVREPGSKVRPWTSCADAQRAALRERVPSYTNYANAEASAGSWDEIVAEINAMIAWRDELWSSLPLCADTLELALTFSLLAGNRRALVAFRQARVADEKNPYWEAIELGEHIIDGYGGWLVGGSAVRQSAQRLRSCTDTELQSLSITVAQYYMLREAMTNIENMRDFVNTADAVLVWRDSLLGILPNCSESFEAGVLMSQIADDYIALLGLTYAGYGRDVNPYVDVILTNSVELTELLQSAPIDKGDYAAVWDYGGQLEACNQDEITTLDLILSEYLALQDAAQQISSLDLLAAFGDAQIAWRSELWPTLPNCAEAFEIGLHIFRNAGDQIHFDVPVIATDQLAQVFGGKTLLHERLGEIFAELPLKWRPEHSGEFVSYRRRCTAGQAADIINVLKGFKLLIGEREALLAEPAGILRYIDKRIEWRGNQLPYMPRCLIVFSLDSIPELELAQGMASSIPVLGAFLSGSDLINAIATVFAEDEAKAPAVQPYKNRMPICSDTELRGLLDDFPRLTDLIDNIPDLGSRDALYDYIRSKLAWRREIWANMPICAESLEIGMLIHQIASDAATTEALGYHDLPEYLNPYIGLETEGRAALLNARKQISGLVQSGERANRPAFDPLLLPRCTDAELDTVYGYTFDHQLFPTFPEKSIDALVEYAYQVLSWRAETWAPLPGCVEAYLLGSLVSRQVGDYVNFSALAWLPGDRGENPFAPDSRNNALNLVSLTQSLKHEDMAQIDIFVDKHYPPGS